MAASMLDSASLTAHHRYDLAPGDIANGYLRSTELVGGAHVATDLTFRPLTFQAGAFSGGPGVSEPSSWAMLLAGFAALGTVLRPSARRSRPKPAAAAT